MQKDPEVMKLKEKEAVDRDSRERDEASNVLRSLMTCLTRKAFVSYREAWIKEEGLENFHSGQGLARS